MSAASDIEADRLQKLVEIVEAALLVREGVVVTREIARERARNIVQMIEWGGFV